MGRIRARSVPVASGLRGRIIAHLLELAERSDASTHRLLETTSRNLEADREVYIGLRFLRGIIDPPNVMTYDGIVIHKDDTYTILRRRTEPRREHVA